MASRRGHVVWGVWGNGQYAWLSVNELLCVSNRVRRTEARAIVGLECHG